VGAAGARVARGFFRGGVHGLPGEELAQRAATTIAHDLLRRADTGTAPLAECVLHDPVLPRVIGDHRDDARRGQTVTQRRERSSERVEFAVDGDAQRLEEPREVTGAGARPEDQFRLAQINLSEALELKEHGYSQAEQFPGSPRNYADAKDNYSIILGVMGEICG